MASTSVSYHYVSLYLVKFGDTERSYYISTFYESLNLTFKSSTISIEILAFLPAKIADITNNVKG